MKRADTQQNLERFKYVTMVNMIAILVVAFAILIVSAASLAQTISAFNPVADPSLIVFGIPLGLTLPVVYGVLFQYGQNAALYVRKHYTNDDPLVDWSILGFDVTSRNIALLFFMVCAIIDAGTNVVWFYKNVEPSGDAVIDALLFGVGYPSMILVVFAEEVFGLVLQAFRRVKNEYKSIKDRELAQGVINNRRPPRNQTESRQPVQTPYMRPASSLNRPTPRSDYATREPIYYPIQDLNENDD